MDEQRKVSRKTERVNTRVTPEFKMKLEAAASRAGQPLTWFVRFALERALKEAD